MLSILSFDVTVGATIVTANRIKTVVREESGDVTSYGDEWAIVGPMKFVSRVSGDFDAANLAVTAMASQLAELSADAEAIAAEVVDIKTDADAKYEADRAAKTDPVVTSK